MVAILEEACQLYHCNFWHSYSIPMSPLALLLPSALVIWWHTCWQGPVVSAWAQVHHLGHRSVSPCRRTPWWSGLLCLWGNSCTENRTDGQKRGRIRHRLIVQAEFIYPGLDTKDTLLPLTCPCVQIQSIWWQWCCWCQLSLWRKPPAPECLCSTPESATTDRTDTIWWWGRTETTLDIIPKTQFWV